MAYVLNFLYPDSAPLFMFETGGKEWIESSREFGWGIPMHPDFRPPTIATEIERLALCDVFPFEDTFAVSEKFRAIIEEHEPGVHQFYPIKLKRNVMNIRRYFLGKFYKQTYYVFNVCQRFDAIFTTDSKRVIERPRSQQFLDDQETIPKGTARTFAPSIGTSHSANQKSLADTSGRAT